MNQGDKKGPWAGASKRGGNDLVDRLVSIITSPGFDGNSIIEIGPRGPEVSLPFFAASRDYNRPREFRLHLGITRSRVFASKFGREHPDLALVAVLISDGVQF
jgi:hypothetical protein